MTYLTEADKNWKQAQAILLGVNKLLNGAIITDTNQRELYYLKWCLRCLQSAHKQGLITTKDAYNLENKVDWYNLLLAELEDVINPVYTVAQYPPLDDLTVEDHKRVNFAGMLRWCHIGYKSQVNSLQGFIELAKLDADIAQAKQSTVTKGSPLAKIISDQKKTKVVPIPDGFMDTPFHEYTIRSLRRRR